MWGWLDSIVGGLKSIWETVTNLPQLIVDAFSGLWDSLKEWIDGVREDILSLPANIGAVIEDIFIPDTEYMDTAFKSFVQEMKIKFNFDTEFFENMFSAESPVTDTYMDYNIPGLGDFKLQVLDVSYFVDGVIYFRPFIRGFTVLMMMLYHIRMIVGFFGYNSGIIPGKQEEIKNIDRDDLNKVKWR